MKTGNKHISLRSFQHRHQGFTLIELLVVVLIIVILAAIALPQYQRAIERSKAMQAQTLLKSIGEKGKLYYLETGVYPASWANLDIQLNWPGKYNPTEGLFDAISNEDWAVEFYDTAWLNARGVFITRLKGSYKGGGFLWFWTHTNLPSQQVLCFERIQGGKILFKNLADSYCKKLFGGTPVGGEWVRYYTLP